VETGSKSKNNHKSYIFILFVNLSSQNDFPLSRLLEFCQNLYTKAQITQYTNYLQAIIPTRYTIQDFDIHHTFETHKYYVYHI